MLKCCFKGLLVLFPIALMGFIEYKFYNDYIIPQLNSSGNHGGAYFNLAFNAYFVAMILWCLMQTWLRDPGYIKSYIKAEMV